MSGIINRNNLLPKRTLILTDVRRLISLKIGVMKYQKPKMYFMTPKKTLLKARKNGSKKWIKSSKKI